jgi:hypothetical protein
MCKEYKFAQLGDGERMPYSAVKQFPTPDGHRVNRHDAELWGDDGGADPTWPPDTEFGRNPRRRKKNTRRWCKGIVGREHKLTIRLRYGTCRSYTYRSRRDISSEKRWTCYHEIVCEVCGKIVRSFLDKTECPTWLEAHGISRVDPVPALA